MEHAIGKWRSKSLVEAKERTEKLRMITALPEDLLQFPIPMLGSSQASAT